MKDDGTALIAEVEALAASKHSLIHAQLAIRDGNWKAKDQANDRDQITFDHSACCALAEVIVGQASVVDGDTLEIHGERICLSGIDAPESDQLCPADDSLQYRCGAKAANELDEHIAGTPLSCEGVGRDQYGRTVAVCSVAGEDVGERLVRNGLAFDWSGTQRACMQALRKQRSARVVAYGRAATSCLGPIGLA